MKKKFGIIIQSRLTSKRFPKNVIKKINKLSISEILFKRVKLSKQVNKVIFTIPDNSRNNLLFDHLRSMGADIFRGNEKNVLERYYLTAKKYGIDVIIRITGDCPLVDSKIIDEMVIKFKRENID